MCVCVCVCVCACVRIVKYICSGTQRRLIYMRPCKSSTRDRLL